MLRGAFLAVSLLCRRGAALGAAVVGATERGVAGPHHIARVLPAGPRVAILLAGVCSL
jgi:hypothetical protein